MIINFIKMHALGNDFVIVDNTYKNIYLNTEAIKLISNRNLGVGCDQLIIIEEIIPRELIKMTIYNADGTKVSACGNATSCVSYYIHTKYQINKIKIQTDTRELQTLAQENNVLVNMGCVSFKAKDIPLSNPNLDPKNLEFPEILQEKGIALNIGNPHVVFVVNELDNINLNEIGPKVENHIYFPEKVNVEFIKIINKHTVRMIVWERGTGRTKACGTGASASFAVASMLNLVNNNVKIILDGGELLIHTNKKNEIIINNTPTFVFEGKFYL